MARVDDLPGFILAAAGAAVLAGVAYLFGSATPLPDPAVCLPAPHAWPLYPPVACILNFALLLVIGSAMTIVNRQFNLEQGTSALGASFFLVATAAIPALTQGLSGSMFMAFAIIAGLFYLFRNYERTDTARPLFITGTLMGWGFPFDYAFIFPAVGMALAAATLRELNVKSACAYIFGLLTPLVILLGFGATDFSDFTFTNPYARGFDYPWPTVACAAVTTLTSLMLLMRQAVVPNNQSSHSAALNRGINVLLLVMMASMAVDCCNIQLYLPAVNMLAGFVISGIAGDRRFSSSGLLIFVLITLYIILFCFAL